MRELTLSEMSDVSGSGIIADIGGFVVDRTLSSVLGGVTAAVNGGAIGFLHGGDATGIWGLSIIGQLVGAVGGGVIGGVGGFIGGFMVPLSYTYPLVIEAAQNLIAGGIK